MYVVSCRFNPCFVTIGPRQGCSSPKGKFTYILSGVILSCVNYLSYNRSYADARSAYIFDTNMSCVYVRHHRLRLPLSLFHPRPRICSQSHNNRRFESTGSRISGISCLSFLHLLSCVKNLAEFNHIPANIIHCTADPGFIYMPCGFLKNAITKTVKVAGNYLNNWFNRKPFHILHIFLTKPPINLFLQIHLRLLSVKKFLNSRPYITPRL